MIKAPHTWYQVMVDFGHGIGVGPLTQGFANRDEVADELSDYHRVHDEVPVFRVFRIDMDVETNAPESIADVTEDVIDEYFADGWGN